MSKESPLEEIICQDMTRALKNSEKIKLSTLRMIRAAIKNAEIAKKDKLSNDEIISIVNNYLNKIKESLDIFIKGKRLDLVDNAKKEIEIIKEYLPEQLSEEKIKEIVKETIIKFNFKTLRDLGPAMKEIVPQLKGKADGKLVNKIVRDLLEDLKN